MRNRIDTVDCGCCWFVDDVGTIVELVISQMNRCGA